MVQNIINEKNAMKNIKNLMEGKDDDVILLTDVYHEDTEYDNMDEKYTKHKSVLEDINDTLDFINNSNIKQTNSDTNNQIHMLKQSAIKDSLKKLYDAKMQDKKSAYKKDEMPLSSTSIEDLLINLLRPQLVNWLNDNLPTIVEKEVKRVIEKIMSTEQ